MRLKQIPVYPFWFLALFTRAKSFRANPILGNRLLNRCGLHVVRVVAAWIIYHCRRGLMWWLLPAAERREFKLNGYLVKEDFLPRDTFMHLAEEIKGFHGETWESIEGDTVTRHIFLDYETLAVLPRCGQFLNRPELLRPLKWCTGKLTYPRFFIQQIMNHYTGGGMDPQKVLHSDTFHPTVKCWYFLEDVGVDQGPFTYVPGSHRLGWKKLAWLYRRSCVAAGLNDGHSEDGSFRIGEDGLQALDLGRPIALAVKKNTLVIADTSGFHCRGAAADPGIRLEIFGFFRPNPFNPLPGIDLQAGRRLSQWLVRHYYLYRDKKCRARGEQAFWHRTADGAGITPRR